MVSEQYACYVNDLQAGLVRLFRREFEPRRSVGCGTPLSVLLFFALALPASCGLSLLFLLLEALSELFYTLEEPLACFNQAHDAGGNE